MGKPVKWTLKNSAGRKLFRRFLLGNSQNCFYCRCQLTIETITFDHYLPISAYPHLRYAKNNIVGCCLDCNRKKGNMMPDDFFDLLEAEADATRELVEIMESLQA